MGRIFICIIFLSVFSVNEVNSQIPCSLSGASVYLDYSSTPALMNASVNGMSLYDYTWNNGSTMANQILIYSLLSIRLDLLFRVLLISIIVLEYRQ